MGVVRKPAARWAAEVDARRAVVPDAGHIANQDNPDDFNAILADFLDSLVPEGQHVATDGST